VWYNQTYGLPDDVVVMAVFELGPGFDSSGTPMDARASVVWKGPKGDPDYSRGYLFASPEALRTMNVKPLVVPIRGEDRTFDVKPAGYIGNPGGYVPPHYPDTYRHTPFPNHLMAFIITERQPTKTAKTTGDLIIKPIYQ